MIPIAEKDLNTNYVSKRIDVKLDRETAILFKRLRQGLEYIGAFDSESEPTVAMAIREIIRRVADEAVVVSQDGQPAADESKTPTAKPQAATTATQKPRLPKSKQ